MNKDDLKKATKTAEAHLRGAIKLANGEFSYDSCAVTSFHVGDRVVSSMYGAGVVDRKGKGKTLWVKFDTPSFWLGTEKLAFGGLKTFEESKEELESCDGRYALYREDGMNPADEDGLRHEVNENE